jgi:hypothetical protein
MTKINKGKMTKEQLERAMARAKARKEERKAKEQRHLEKIGATGLTANLFGVS